MFKAEEDQPEYRQNFLNKEKASHSCARCINRNLLFCHLPTEHLEN